MFRYSCEQDRNMNNYSVTQLDFDVLYHQYSDSFDIKLRTMVCVVDCNSNSDYIGKKVKLSVLSNASQLAVSELVNLIILFTNIFIMFVI